MSQLLERTVFHTSRLLEYFSLKELQLQLGAPPNAWPIALLKELLDNALDGCEAAGLTPQIAVTVEPDAVSVRDNGPGWPAETLTRSLDDRVRVSDKGHDVSPTRGQRRREIGASGPADGARLGAVASGSMSGCGGPFFLKQAATPGGHKIALPA
jgi:DNA topoisomerase VI subunit B